MLSVSSNEAYGRRGFRTRPLAARHHPNPSSARSARAAAARRPAPASRAARSATNDVSRDIRPYLRASATISSADRLAFRCVWRDPRATATPGSPRAPGSGRAPPASPPCVRVSRARSIGTSNESGPGRAVAVSRTVRRPPPPDQRVDEQPAAGEDRRQRRRGRRARRAAPVDAHVRQRRREQPAELAHDLRFDALARER